MANPVDPPHEAACVDSHLPPATVAVYLDPSQKDWVVPYVRGLVAVSGVMAVGRHEETDGRVSWVRLQLEALFLSGDCAGVKDAIGKLPSYSAAFTARAKEWEARCTFEQTAFGGPLLPDSGG